MKDKKKMILSYLKSKGQQSETNISNEIRSNLWTARRYLIELESDNKIKRLVAPSAVYWDILEASK